MRRLHQTTDTLTDRHLSAFHGPHASAAMPKPTALTLQDVVHESRLAGTCGSMGESLGLHRRLCCWGDCGMPARVTRQEAAPQASQQRPGNAPRKPVITVMGTLGSSSAMTVDGSDACTDQCCYGCCSPTQHLPKKETNSFERNTATQCD